MFSINFRGFTDKENPKPLLAYFPNHFISYCMTNLKSLSLTHAKTNRHDSSNSEHKTMTQPIKEFATEQKKFTLRSIIKCF